MMHVYIVSTGYKYEGEIIHSVHRSKYGADTSALVFRETYNKSCKTKKKWSYRGEIGIWECEDYYIRIQVMEVQP